MTAADCVLNEPVFSSFAGDLEMLPIIEMFVSDVPRRASAMMAALAADDFQLLLRLAHQMHGAAGGYGFAEVSRLAGELERSLRDAQGLANSGRNDGSAGDISQQVETLVAVCGRVRLST